MYGIVKSLLKQQKDVHGTVLIESPFNEKTRFGTYCDTVLMALTPSKLVIASEKNDDYKKKRYKESDANMENFELHSIYPLNSVKLTIFKRTQKQSLKVVFNEMAVKYFELGRMERRNIFWKLWCHHVNEINSDTQTWPYKKKYLKYLPKVNTLRWVDKSLYLGSIREVEDQNRPVPIPGIGRTEEKLYYLKPFGCVEPAELEYNEERQETTQDYEDLTYTDDPNSNITYTSLMTTVGIIGQF